MTFHGWIIDNLQENDQLYEFIIKIAGQGKKIEEKEEILNAINNSELLETEKNSLKEKLNKEWNNYLNLHKTDWRSYILNNMSLILLAVVIGVATIVMAQVILPWGTLRSELGNADITRGLIAFVLLFTVIFVIFFLLIGLHSSKDPEIILKFDKSKEILTSIIAIFGTILGFYFGSETGRVGLVGENATIVEVPTVTVPEQVEGNSTTREPTE